ncbi:MAG: M23 family metallopeptidase, partial [Defluviitaleaceae bacterium]|nr:M23 family metallopeptidase [Defluviitaleaceae bacterium]
NEIRNNLDLINTLAEHDRQLMDNLHMAQHVLAVRQQEVEDMQAEFEDLRYHQMRYYEELRATEEAKNALMYELGEREATLQASLDQYAADARALDAAIRAAEEELRRQQLANQPDGYMAWPIPSVPRSNITSPFNPNRLHPILRVRRPHNGIDLRAASGTPIVAAHDGVVTFSGVQGNFGNLVIIYHGGGISTLYAHNSRNLVSRGDTVTRGQRIALVGSTGLSTGPHLHFEVRRNNVPENPMPWLDGQNRP